MSSTALPTCRYCDAPAMNPASLAQFDETGALTGYRRGPCLAHMRSHLWDRQRPHNDDYDTGCPSCGHHWLGIIINWSTPTHSSNGAHYRPYYSDADIEEWSFEHDGSFGLSWNRYMEWIVDNIFDQAAGIDPPNNNALAGSDNAIPNTVTDYFDNDNYEQSRNHLYQSVTLRSYCENCERELSCEWY